MVNAAKRVRPQFRPHVHAYLWIAVLLMCGVPFIVADLTATGRTGSDRAFEIAIAVAALFLVSLWFAGRKCSVPEYSWWYGMQVITGSMTIGIGGLSIMVGVPVAIIAILVSIAVAFLGATNGDASYAPRQFHRLVRFAHRNRMYQ
jgi:hypothetical protein